MGSIAAITNGARHLICGGIRPEVATGFLSIQMESLRAVTNVKKLAIEGVDCLTWGPNDLLFDIESHSNPLLSTVDDCVEHALNQLGDSQTKISFRSYDYKLRDKYFDMGVTVLMESPRS